MDRDAVDRGTTDSPVDLGAGSEETAERSHGIVDLSRGRCEVTDLSAATEEVAAESQ